jgi:two-component system OmpR family response regulator
MVRGRVLVIDDNSNIRDLLRAALEMEGYDVETVINGAAGLRSLERLFPDVVLLDILMPGMDGRQFVREVKDRTVGVQVVVITALPDPAKLAQEVGADDFIQKPFELHELLSVVERAYKRVTG